MFKAVPLFLIKVYQKTLSPDHGIVKNLFPEGYCRYTPTCSQYAYDAISKKGVIVGILMGSWRIIRCNPFTKGGEDPVR